MRLDDPDQKIELGEIKQQTIDWWMLPRSHPRCLLERKWWKYAFAGAMFWMLLDVASFYCTVTKPITWLSVKYET